MTVVSEPASRQVSLDDKYLLEEGRIFLTGLQAILRLAFDQHRADARAGLSTATMISGYPGSPLGGFDLEVGRQRRICERHAVFHVPAVNEELGATTAWGSQLAGNLPGARYDGVRGIWYGKAPGLDRAADSLRHGNFVGVSRTGGGLAVVGDDPSCKSSTVPSASESLLANLHLPVFFPGNVQEVIDLGQHAFACSRASGLWCGLKVVTNVADGSGTATVGRDRIAPTLPSLEWEGRPFEHSPSAMSLVAPRSLEIESTVVGPRRELALAYARENEVNRWEGPADAWLGVVAAGTGYHDLWQALREMGLDAAALERAGVRILKPGMLWPLEPGIVADFARGLEEILVVEEKRPFLEPQIKEILYGTAAAPRVVGKRDESGAPLLPVDGDIDSDRIARAFAARLRRRVELDSVEARLRRIEESEERPPALLPMAGGPAPRRTPYFCSGCPHNSSTPAPDGTLVGAGIGCHTMILLSPEGRGDITGITQMGGEGAQWIGMAPFTADEHFVQNVGDGTFHHSGSLALRAAVAAGANVTYKIFHNSAIAMTGGQPPQGMLDVPELTRLLEVEGVTKAIVTAVEPERYRGVELAPIAELRGRDSLMEAQRELAGVKGVTALIHDQECAAELRRKRKRGKAPEPAQRIHINERVCEGCGDCGEKSNCLSVQPVETEFGRKTQIHQSSCNKDYSCLKGDCPSFLTVTPGRRQRRRELPEPPAMPDPEPIVGAEEFSVRMMGIGGTGVVTVNQILGVAALIDGRHVAGLDQTGQSVKGGPVTSDLRISTAPAAGNAKAVAAGTDLYLGFDLLGAVLDRNLVTADPERTVAVVSTSAVPTGQMVIDTEERFPAISSQLDLIDGATRKGENVYLDAQELAQRLFDDHMPANMLTLGAAYQRGALPISREALETAIRLNGAAVEKNLAAFAWGRACVAAPDAIEAATHRPGGEEVERRPLAGFEADLVAAAAPAEGELRRLLEIRVPDLVDYQDRAYAERYVAFVREVATLEAERAAGRGRATEAVARHLHRLMAYKDEYEVARLHLDAVEQARLREEFGPDAKVRFNLHPPLLRALGLDRKIELGEWFVPALRTLRRLKRLRGKPIDPFGHAKVRRVERALIGEYEGLVREALSRLTPENHETVVELCELPDAIRGYEEIKLRGVERFRARAATLLGRLGATVPG